MNQQNGWLPPRISDAVVADPPDPLSVRSLRVGLLLLIEARGLLDGSTVVQLTSAFQAPDGVGGILVDLSGLTALDPVAADQILLAHDRLGDQGTQVVLRCPPGEPRDALEAAGVTDLVPAFVDPDDAIDAASGDGR
ncbi:MAG TPA: STAS domain-containing protein [Thermoleophilaceae bacterium]|jgi:anti-anti-sigma regulatory factor